MQDHTLWEVLREPDIALWREKAAWLAAKRGLVNAIVHPDYALTDERLRQYDELLGYLAGLEGGWHALPRDVAAWWRRRAALVQALERGDAVDDDALVWVSERDGEIVVRS